MPQDWRAVLVSARKGSSSDVLLVAQSVLANGGSSPLTLSEQVSYATTLFDALDVLSKEPVSVKTSSALGTTIHAWTKLGFSFFKSRPRLFERLNGALLVLRIYIPRVLEALVDRNCLPKVDDVDAEMHLHFVWSCSKLQTFVDGKEEHHLLDDIETFKLMVRVWLAEWSPEGNSLASAVFSLCLSAPTTKSLQALYERNVPKRTFLLETASSTLGFSADDIMCLALSRFRRAKVDYVGALFGILSFLFGSFKDFDAPDIQAYYRAFERQGGVKVIVKSLQKILDSWNFDMDAPETLRIPNNDTLVLSRTLGSLKLVWVNFPTFSVTLVKQALSGDIIRILASCSSPHIFSLIDEAAKRDLRFLVKNIIGGSIMIRSVLLATQRSLQKYQLSKGRRRSAEYSLSEVFPSVTRSRARSTWEAFFRRLNHQASSFRIISRERDVILFECGNPACDARSTKFGLFRCAGCYLTLFCSQSCQASAWSEHRTECDRLKQSYVSSGISARDGDYLAVYAQEDARRKLSAAYRKSANPIELDGSAAIIVAFEDGEQEVLFADNMYDGPGVPRTMIIGEGEVKELQIAIRIRYRWGREGREYLATAVLDSSIMEGKWCSCCRFHITENTSGLEMDCTKTIGDGEKCPVHVKP